MAARSTIGIKAAAQIVGVSIPFLVYRIRAARIPVCRRKPIRIRLAVLLDNLEALRVKHPTAGRPLGSTKTTQSLEAVLR